MAHRYHGNMTTTKKHDTIADVKRRGRIRRGKAKPVRDTIDPKALRGNLYKRPRKENIPNHNGEPTGERPDGFAASDVVGAHHHENQNNLRRPWQRTVAAYEVRDGGIYLRKFNVRLATFVPNSALLRDALARMFDAAHALVESERGTLAAPDEYAAAKLPKVRAGKTVTRRGALRSQGKE